MLQINDIKHDTSCLKHFRADEISTVYFPSNGATHTGGRTRVPLPPPGSLNPLFLSRLFLRSPSSSPAIPASFCWRIVRRVSVRGGGDDHASKACGAAEGAPDPVGPVLLLRARRLLAQPTHRIQVRIPHPGLADA
jgi:hypothetical protein